MSLSSDKREMEIDSEDLKFNSVIKDSWEDVDNDGGKNNFYNFPDYVNNVDSLARYWKSTGAEFNVLKSLTANVGNRHLGTSISR